MTAIEHRHDSLREYADGLGGWADRLWGSEGPIRGSGSHRAHIRPIFFFKKAFKFSSLYGLYGVLGFKPLLGCYRLRSLAHGLTA